MNDSTIFLTASLISLILCLMLIWFYRNSRQMLDEMWAVHTYDARELRLMCKDGFAATVEVVGDISCDNPMTSLAAKIPCCWFRTIVKRERKSHSRSGVKLEWDVIFDHTFSAISKVTDQTGYTLLDPMNADVDSEHACDWILDKTQPWFYDLGITSSRVKSTLDLLNLPSGWFDNSMLSDTGQYKITEEVFLPMGQVYILGEAICHEDGALIHCPSKGYVDPKKKFFIISRKSEKQLAKSNQTSISICFWSAIIAFLLSAYCALCASGLISTPHVIN